MWLWRQWSLNPNLISARLEANLMVMLFYMLEFVLVHGLVIFLPKAAAFIAKIFPVLAA